jgi:hypothetical protein
MLIAIRGTTDTPGLIPRYITGESILFVPPLAGNPGFYWTLRTSRKSEYEANLELDHSRRIDVRERRQRIGSRPATDELAEDGIGGDVGVVGSDAIAVWLGRVRRFGAVKERYGIVFTSSARIIVMPSFS